MDNNFGFVRKGDGDYPVRLEEIYKPPDQLFYRGNLMVLREKCVAVVGTRHCSDYGLLMTRKIVNDLVEAGVVIVSGLALGIDTEAHERALEAGGKTVAVIGSGLNNIYPSDNRNLAERIAREGVVVSEFEAEDEALPWHFPMRNRIISGLCEAVVVVEAPKKSGALITAKYALEQGRDIFVVPGDVDRRNSEGIMDLLQNGAAFPVRDGKEILDQMGVGKLFGASAVRSPPVQDSLINLENILGGREKEIYKVLSYKEWLSADFITRKLMTPIVEVMNTMTMLEIKGLVEMKNGRYRKIRS